MQSHSSHHCNYRLGEVLTTTRLLDGKRETTEKVSKSEDNITTKIDENVTEGVKTMMRR